MFDQYDVIVVGAGHAGCEAAVAAANLGSRVMLVTMNMQTIGQMSCNPAMGGVAKGQIVREIDALGGYSGLVTDATTIQFRMLNLSKGPAMWSPRAQNDRMLFAGRWREMLEQHPNIDFWQEMVNGILVKDNRAVGVVTGMGQEIRAKAVILTNGTFLNGVIHIGEKQFGGGRAGEKASTGITEQLIELGFEAARMKTGTPPRVDARSLDFSKMDVQPGDEKPGRFSFLKTEQPLVQLPCYITYTSQEVHDILKTGFDRSPMFNGRIQGLGPRYCPSIEDKIDRFSDKDRHQLFVEPEGLNTVEMYINGFSSSLPEDVQYNALRRVPGFENVKMFRPGYAIEYDFFPPTQLKPSLETHRIAHLFFAGQINGTTGYEEAASQGLMAGINAHLSIHEQDPFILKRSDAYIGVLIDDLVNKGTDEPYRMFTSRAEYRILLRQDNADLRLSPLGEKLGIRGMEPRMERVREKEQTMAFVTDFFKKQSIDPDQINGALEQAGSAPLKQKVKLHSILLRPGIGIDWITQHVPFVREALAPCDAESLLSAEIAMKYEGYIEKERDLAGKMERLEQIRLRPDFDYHALPSLSMEARQKLSAQKPATIGQASRISGVNPADISVLLVYVGR
jgi:tRNA uridine 5-carboxymethylaminomethyl modification enzyme